MFRITDCFNVRIAIRDENCAVIRPDEYSVECGLPFDLLGAAEALKSRGWSVKSVCDDHIVMDIGL